MRPVPCARAIVANESARISAIQAGIVRRMWLNPPCCCLSGNLPSRCPVAQFNYRATRVCAASDPDTQSDQPRPPPQTPAAATDNYRTLRTPRPQIDSTTTSARAARRALLLVARFRFCAWQSLASQSQFVSPAASLPESHSQTPGNTPDGNPDNQNCPPPPLL